jgi:hypothetical protein
MCGCMYVAVKTRRTQHTIVITTRGRNIHILVNHLHKLLQVFHAVFIYPQSKNGLNKYLGVVFLAQQVVAFKVRSIQLQSRKCHLPRFRSPCA